MRGAWAERLYLAVSGYNFIPPLPLPPPGVYSLRAAIASDAGINCTTSLTVVACPSSGVTCFPPPPSLKAQAECLTPVIATTAFYNASFGPIVATPSLPAGMRFAPGNSDAAL